MNQVAFHCPIGPTQQCKDQKVGIGMQHKSTVAHTRFGAFFELSRNHGMSAPDQMGGLERSRNVSNLNRGSRP